MDAAGITQFIKDTFVGVEIVDDAGNLFYFTPGERNFPFVTLVTSDKYDQFSNLNREGVFRLNIGVSKATFQSLFTSDNWDFTAIDQIMPHPVYGKMYWICVVNPSDATFETVKLLMVQIFERARTSASP